MSVVVLRELERDGIVWQVRRGADRGRLELIAIVPASPTATIVHALDDADLRQLLNDAPVVDASSWSCAECGAQNGNDRRWCRRCSSHGSAHA